MRANKLWRQELGALREDTNWLVLREQGQGMLHVEGMQEMKQEQAAEQQQAAELPNFGGVKGTLVELSAEG